MNSAILRWSSDGTLTFFNEYAEHLFGWRSDEVVGRHVNILLPEPAGPDGPTGLAEEVVRDPDHYTTHVNENARKDGSRLWMAWTNHAARDDEGAVREMLAVGTDISELVQAQSRCARAKSAFVRWPTSRRSSSGSPTPPEAWSSSIARTSSSST